VGVRGGADGAGGAMLLDEAGEHCVAVGVEGGDSGGCRLGHERARGVEEQQEAADQGELSRGESVVLHALKVGFSGWRSNARDLTR
jgi:hypothetical protein